MGESQKMNNTIIEAKIVFKKHIWTNYSNYKFVYESCIIDYMFICDDKDLNMLISINSTLSRENVWSVFVELLDFLYLAFGTMPRIVYYKENGTAKNLSNILSRFLPSDQHFKSEHIIDVSEFTLNEKTLSDLKNIIRNKPFEIFWAFTALTSTAYEHIYSEHKITLLLQCFEGYIYNTASPGIDFKSRISQIVNVLFDYDKQYNSEILSTLSVSEEEYLNILKDTRHQFSHYISKRNSLSQGQEYIINFILLHYTFRIYLLTEIGIQPNEKNIEEFFKSIYDWINVLKNPNFNNFKSVAYSMNFVLKQLNNTKDKGEL